jgi:hypothetical protein
VIIGFGPGISTAVVERFGSATIADAFWSLYKGRSEIRARVS